MFFDLFPYPSTAPGCVKRGNSVRPVRRGPHPQPADTPPAEAPPATPSDSGKPNAVDSEGNDLGYPVETPWRDMAPEQQVNYWKWNDRKKSDKLDAYGGITPEQAKQYKDAADAAARAQMTPADQALADARTEGIATGSEEAAKVWAPQLAEAIVSQFITDEKARPAVMAGLNPMTFVKDGKFDTDGLIGHLTGLSAAFGGGHQEQQPRQWGQQGNPPPAPSASEAGLAAAKARGYIK